MKGKEFLKSNAIYLVIISLYVLSYGLSYGKSVIFGGSDSIGKREIFTDEEIEEIKNNLEDFSIESFQTDGWDEVRVETGYISAYYKDCIVSIRGSGGDEEEHRIIYYRTWDGFSDYVNGNFKYDTIFSIVTDDWDITIREFTKTKNSDTIKEAMNMICNT